jgi:uncharacterized protein YbbK (DUF523 family)
LRFVADEDGEESGAGSLPVIVVSACLLGVECNHRGRGSRSEAVHALEGGARLVAVCPEVAGGLPTPRPAAELQADGRVRTEAGEDVTDAYLRGAAQAVDVARAAGAARAVLKARSPSCGSHEVYDGSFTGKLIRGIGIAAAALAAAGLEVVSEEDVAAVARLGPPPSPGASTMDASGA